jgi:cyclase
MMINKRIIYSLLYSNGFFYLSRNFRLQKVGDINWIRSNYGFGEACNSIDELIVSLVTYNPDKREYKEYFKNIKILKKNFFVPLTLGGGIKNFDNAKMCFDNGADKILINTAFYNNNKLLDEIAEEFGAQANTLMIDYKEVKKKIFSFKNCGKIQEQEININFIKKINKSNVGDVIFNSMDRDGNAAGLDINFAKKIVKNLKKPLLIMGGAGKPEHIINCLSIKKISGVVTANLFNFLGSGLSKIRNEAIIHGIPMAKFNINLSSSNV